MLSKWRGKLQSWIEAGKDVPVLAGVSIGFYMLLFYYSRNFALANSWQQFFAFAGYYVLLPAIFFWLGYKLVAWLTPPLTKNFLFTGMVAVFTFFAYQMSVYGFSRLRFGLICIAALVLSFWTKKYYKFLIVLFFGMSLFNIGPLIKIVTLKIANNNNWQQQPDHIEKAVFKSKPNIYYIQPDGYTNEENLNGSTYNFDNSGFISYLSSKGFKVYDDYHSNYYSTLTSNSSAFAMKHHYLQDDVELYSARDVIIGDNAVLRTLKNNGYKTSFISEKLYLLMNRPKSGYDLMNFDYSEIPYIKDGWFINKDALADLKQQIGKNGKSGNFYFIEKLTPNHIRIYDAAEGDAAAETKLYLEALKTTNVWLKETVDFIEKNDPDALIIIAADHGGFCGFTHTHATLEKTTDPLLVKSIFGAHLSIKWNNPGFEKYDDGLKSTVNLFRVVFSYLADDGSLLNNLQDNSSYISLEKPSGIYRYINNDGKVVFEKADAVQDRKIQ